MTPLRSFSAAVDRLDSGLFRLAQVIACVSVFAMIVVTFIDVAGRHFATPLPGAAEFISTLLGIAFFAGMSLVVRNNSHIVAGLAVTRYPAGLRVVERVLTAAVSFLSMVGITWLMFVKAQKLLDAQMLTKFLEVQLGYSVYAFAVLALIATVIGFFRLLRVGIHDDDT
ncbi:TRAP transporter small permease [Marinobacter sp. JSM 1782161]|uniref:TRAP transporter small permease n=1 Tax=Marinobacter sp. JSM 1782161 TaxID=2685906 RepID=UPI001401C699|nr:TRAP transporter small permease subunit [Marinobacter sp. JSM 1782161]